MKLSLFDLHCDTALEMLHRHQGLEKNELAVSLAGADGFERYMQVMALWTPYHLDDEAGWKCNREMLKKLKSDPAIASQKAVLRTAPDQSIKSPQLFLAVEDVRIIDRDLDRLDILYSDGVRIITPMWRGVNIIGGAHDTDVGLTDFGKEALKHALELGMTLDISHASRRSTDEIFSLCKDHNMPVIASHSNAYAVCPVPRNLTDDEIKRIVSTKGLIGINLCTSFLSDQKASVEDIMRHIEHFLSLGAKDTIALGCDMDGCELPDDIPNVSALSLIAERMLKANYPEELIRAIFFNNAYRFATSHFKP